MPLYQYLIGRSFQCNIVRRMNAKRKCHSLCDSSITFYSRQLSLLNFSIAFVLLLTSRASYWDFCHAFVERKDNNYAICIHCANMKDNFRYLRSPMCYFRLQWYWLGIPYYITFDLLNMSIKRAFLLILTSVLQIWVLSVLIMKMSKRFIMNKQ